MNRKTRRRRDAEINPLPFHHSSKCCISRFEIRLYFYLLEQVPNIVGLEEIFFLMASAFCKPGTFYDQMVVSLGVLRTAENTLHEFRADKLPIMAEFLTNVTLKDVIKMFKEIRK